MVETSYQKKNKETSPTESKTTIWSGSKLCLDLQFQQAIVNVTVEGGTVTNEKGNVNSEGGTVTNEGGNVTTEGGTVTNEGGNEAVEGGSVMIVVGGTVMTEGGNT